MFWIVPPYLSDLVATTCTAGAAGEPGWFYPHLFTGFPSRRRRGAGLLPSSASLPGSFLLWPRLVPGARQANLQPQQNAKYRCARGAVRATRGAAGWEECAFSSGRAEVSAERTQRGRSRSPPLPPAPQKPLGWGAVIPISEQPVPPCHLAGPALSPAAPAAPYPQLGVHSPPRWPQAPLPGAQAGFGPSEHGGDSWAVGGSSQSWLGPCFSLFINHVHYHRNVRAAWTTRCVKEVK